MSKVETALERVRDAVSTASKGLSNVEYNEFLEELCADAEGWSMQLNERQKETSDED